MSPSNKPAEEGTSLEGCQISETCFIDFGLLVRTMIDHYFVVLHRYAQISTIQDQRDKIMGAELLALPGLGSPHQCQWQIQGLEIDRQAWQVVPGPDLIMGHASLIMRYASR